MKTKLVISIFALISFFSVIPTASLRAEEVSSTDTPILSKELPSYSNLQREKRSIAAAKVASLATPSQNTGRAIQRWVDPEMPNVGGGDHNVGAPVGDVTLSVVVFAILIYSVYRGASTSRRRNNF